jgi:hypothetical protein
MDAKRLGIKQFMRKLPIAQDLLGVELASTVGVEVELSSWSLQVPVVTVRVPEVSTYTSGISLALRILSEGTETSLSWLKKVKIRNGGSSTFTHHLVTRIQNR